jgi:hypothetical protein
VISNINEESRNLIGSERIERSAQFAISDALSQTVAFFGSVRPEVTEAFISTVFDPSIKQIVSRFVEATSSYGLSAALLETKSIVSFVIRYSESEISAQQFERTRPVSATGNLARTGNGDFFESLILVVTDVFMKSSTFRVTVQFAESVEIEGSPIVQDSREFAASEYFTTENGENNDGGTDGVKGRGSLVLAIVVSLAALLLIVLGVVFLIRRNRNNQQTDMELAYETETEGNVINLEESDLGNDQADDWDSQDFDAAIEFEFGARTEFEDNPAEDRFPSVCDELF